MINTWWWEAIGALLFIGVMVTSFFSMYELKIVKETKEKLPNANWTVSDACKTISCLNHNTVRHNRQRGIT
ncbi:hypothetical protein BK133_05260 [Paenibacillus sp. FSL H8-0548]|uniref:hypothetical protein n=1 Tax=Paenibacillus sp. FSL H8-0548 TaxID=1920422 RepID=UPI00096C7941|nr:hypothetical protein [Paenibacillus sp. FSL H8-0548]OMF37466.1 hypothetical protein BK133_05260 [Paenibacillus sp. FSL H8-0548]